MPVTEMLGYFGYASLVVSIIVALGNRALREDRITHLKGRVDELRADLKDERESCASKLAEMSHEVSKLQGQVQTMAGEFGHKIGQTVVKEISHHFEELLRELR